MVHCNGLRFKVLPAYEEFEGKKVENVFWRDGWGRYLCDTCFMKIVDGSSYEEQKKKKMEEYLLYE